MHECGMSEDEKAECKFIDDVLAILPDASSDEIADLIPSGYTPAEVATEIKAQRKL